MRRVELYLAWACETKGARPGGANTLVTVWLWVLDDGVAVVGFIWPRLPVGGYPRRHGYGVKRL